MTDFLDRTRKEIGARLTELEPLVDEYERLQSALSALEEVATASAPTAAARRGARHKTTASPERPRGAHTQRRRGRPKGSGTRGAEALQLVRSQPGITIPQMAEKMGIKQNYLYRVLPALANDGLVIKRGRGWHPQDAADATRLEQQPAAAIPPTG